MRNAAMKTGFIYDAAFFLICFFTSLFVTYFGLILGMNSDIDFFSLDKDQHVYLLNHLILASAGYSLIFFSIGYMTGLGDIYGRDSTQTRKHQTIIIHALILAFTYLPSMMLLARNPVHQTALTEHFVLYSLFCISLAGVAYARWWDVRKKFMKTFYK